MTSLVRRAAATATSVLLVTGALATVTATGAAGASGVPAAAAVPTHSVTVTGTGVATYPAFDPSVARYGITTTDATLGTVTVTATTSDPTGKIYVDGRLVTGTGTAVTGLAEGDEIAVFIVDSAGTARHSFIYLPAQFPKLESAALGAPGGSLAGGSVMLTLGLWVTPSPFFETAIDRAGVPVMVHTAAGAMDLKPIQGGHYSVFRTTTEPGRTGVDQVELDEKFAEVGRHRTVGLVNTDGHDVIVEADGGRYLTAYEPHPSDGSAFEGMTDAVIQHITAAGAVDFEWNSSDHVDLGESVLLGTPQFPGDYAHLNSIVVMSDGDLLVSFRHLSSVFKIARTAHGPYAAGDVIWRLGGHQSDFAFTDLDGHPDGGPCAQHTATQLANGNILVFDNGAWNVAPLCINPANPTGAVVDRVPSRVTEWAIDAQAGTASMVWNYELPSRYAIFAGSAQRLANGNTLIGWASSTEAVASEVSPGGTLLWDISTPGTPGVPGTKYFTYRAAHADVADAMAPTISLGASIDGATYRQDDVAVADFSCTDRGGSSLQTCSATTPVGSRLDTRDIGTHTVKVTATDGAGLVTTRTATYRVVSGAYLPDVSARTAAGSAWRGDGKHGTTGQQVTLKLRPRPRAQVASIKVTNDGSRADAMLITGGGSRKGFVVTYRLGGRNVTKAVRAGTLRIPTLAPGASVVLKIRIERTDRVRNGDERKVTVTARSAARGAIRDAVVVRAVARR